MDARLESALADILERLDDGRPTDDASLRAAHPGHWREIREFLDFQARLADGSPDGARVGPYRLLHRLGRGGAGTVYLAACEEDAGDAVRGEHVAVKLLHADLCARPGFVERMLAEAHAAGAVRHPGVARTLDAGTADGAACGRPGERVAYVVTEHVDGQNLRGLLDELGPLDEALVRHLAREMLAALVAIHAAGAVHGDLKPENVLIGPDESVKVADLGVQSPTDAAPADAAFRGTVLYAAPEQFPPLRGPVDGRADLFALGVMLDELIDGAHPLSRSPPTQRSRAASPFLRAFAAALRRDDRDERPASAAAAIALLDAGEQSAWWRQRAASARHERPPDPWSATTPHATAMHGRDRDLDRLRRFVTDKANRSPDSGSDCAAGGRSDAGTARATTIRVEGAPGAGKTRLLQEFADWAHAAGHCVIWAPHELARGADPLADAIAAKCAADGIDPAVHAAQTGDLAPALTAWIGGAPQPEGTPPLVPAVRAHALAAMLRSMARPPSGDAGRPRCLVLVADDLHLATLEDIALLRDTAAAVRNDPVVVVAASRTGSARELADAFPGAPALVVENLPVEAVHAMVGDALNSGSAADRLASETHRCTEGNPHAVLEHLDALRGADALVRGSDGAWTLRDGVATPPGRVSAQAMLAERVAALGRADRELLACAACAGIRFDPGIVARALVRDPGRVGMRLARLDRRHRLVRRAGAEIAFSHHAVRDAVLDALGEDAARAHHDALGAALDAAAIARTGDAAEPPPRDRVPIVRHYLRAGNGARAAPHVLPALDWIQGADRTSEAIELARAALAIPGALTPAERVEVLRRLGTNLIRAGQLDDAVSTFELAAHEAVARGDVATARVCRAERVQAMAQRGALDDCLLAGRELVAEAEAAGEVRGIDAAHAAVAEVLWLLHRDEEAYVHVSRRAEVLRGSGDPLRESQAELLAGEASFLRGRFAEAETHTAAAVALLRGAHAPVSDLCEALGDHGYLLTRLGRRDEAIAVFSESARLAQICGACRRETLARLELGRQLRISGRLSEAGAALERALEVSRRTGDAMAEQGILRELSHHLAGLGSLGDAIERMDESLRVSVAVAYGVGVVQANASCSDLCGRIGDFERARAFALASAEAARALASVEGATVARFAVARWGRGDGRHDRALLREVADAMIGYGARDMAATVVLDVACSQMEDGLADDAAATLEEVRELAGATRIASIALHADACLAALGRGDAAIVARRLADAWNGLPLLTRIEITSRIVHSAARPSAPDGAGTTATAVDPALVADLVQRARNEAAVVVAGAPPAFRDWVRARLATRVGPPQC